MKKATLATKWMKRGLLAGMITLAGLAGAQVAEPVGDVVGVVQRAQEREAEQWELREQLDEIFDDPAFAPSFWGIRVEKLDGTVLYDRDSSKAFIPASNMKLVTTAAILELLGPDHTFETRLEARGPIENGILKGDLVIVGSGDPSFGTWRKEDVPDAEELMKQWAQAIKEAGITQVNGAVVGDGRVFTEEYFSTDWEYSDLPFWYAAGTSGLQVYENVFRFTTAPGKEEGDLATLTFQPDTGYFTYENEILTVAEGGKKDADIVHRNPENNHVRFGGTVPLGTKPFEQRGSVWDGARYTATLLLEALDREGINVRGGAVNVRDINAERIDKDMEVKLVATQVSPPASELIKIINKPSHNFYADSYLRVLGKKFKDVGDYKTGAEVVKEWMEGIGIQDVDHFRMYDGSGLARRNYIKPMQFVDLLRHMHGREELRDLYMESFPISGQELRGRYPDIRMHGRVYGKSGFIGHVRGFSGYIKTVDDETLIFSMMVNALMGSRPLADAAIDKACTILAGVPFEDAAPTGSLSE